MAILYSEPLQESVLGFLLFNKFCLGKGGENSKATKFLIILNYSRNRRTSCENLQKTLRRMSHWTIKQQIKKSSWDKHTVMHLGKNWTLQIENDRLAANNYLSGTSCHSYDSVTTTQFSDQQFQNQTRYYKFLGKDQKTRPGQRCASEILPQSWCLGGAKHLSWEISEQTMDFSWKEAMEGRYDRGGKGSQMSRGRSAHCHFQ